MGLVEEIRKRIIGIPIASGRSNKYRKISFDDLVFVPAQLTKRPVDYFSKDGNISSKTIIGKNSKKPLELETPIMMAAMSFGAISKEAKIALAKASSIAGTVANTGEGGMLSEERENARLLIAQYSTARFGVNEKYLKSADAIEIKIGQGAKPGQGGLLPAHKVTEEIAAIRKVPLGQDVHSPAYHPDINNINDLKNKINEIREITEGKPIIIKLGAALEDDVRLAIEAGPDVIAIDGISGGTGAAPAVMLDELGIPIIPAIVKARSVLSEAGAKQELIVGGGLNSGADVAKALALGADGVFMATSLLIAMGCVQCGLCYKAKCPKGIATQDPELRKNLKIDEAANSIANFIKNSTEEIKMIAGAVGKSNIHDLNKDDLRALTPAMSQIARVKLV